MNTSQPNFFQALWRFRQFRLTSYIFASLIVLCVSGYFILTNLLSTSAFSYPKQEHLHFRLQYVFQGQAEDFGAPRYQVDYVKNICNGTLTESPIHFHDLKDQLVHIHWRNMRGGDVLKFYGLNYVGGLDGYAGFKVDELFMFPPKITPVPIHSQSLPKPKSDDNFYVYSGEKDNFQKRDWNDFLKQDLETFFKTKSKLRVQLEDAERLSWLNQGAIVAQAHAGQNHATQSEEEKHNLEIKEQEVLNQKNDSAQEAKTKSDRSLAQVANNEPVTKTDEELKDINNLLGNVVIFVQKNEPTQEQVKARFDKLEPLTPSVCGG